jgi:hypothetical protein
LISSPKWLISSNKSVINLKNDLLNQPHGGKNVGKTMVLPERVDVETQTKGTLTKDQGDQKKEVIPPE